MKIKKNPIAVSLRQHKQQVVKPKKGKGSYDRNKMKGNNEQRKS